MNFPDFIEKILLEKEFNLLTTAEKANLAEWINSEDEYNSLRALLLKMNSSIHAGEKAILPAAQTREKLDAVFAARHRKPLLFKTGKKQLWVIPAAASVIIALGIIFLMPDKKPSSQSGLTEVKKEIPPLRIPEEETKASGGNPATLPHAKESPEPEFPSPIIPEKVITASISLAEQPDLEELTVVIF